MSQLKRILWHVLMGSTVGLLAISSLAAGDRRAQQGNWDNLKELTPGQRIKVVLNDAKAYRGLFQDVSTDGIRAALPTGNATFARQDVLRVSFRAGSHRLRNAGIGAAIGAGGGVGLAAAVSGRNSMYGTLSGEGVALGTIVGSVSGALVGLGAASQAWRDVYRAR